MPATSIEVFTTNEVCSMANVFIKIHTTPQGDSINQSNFASVCDAEGLINSWGKNAYPLYENWEQQGQPHVASMLKEFSINPDTAHQDNAYSSDGRMLLYSEPDGIVIHLFDNNLRKDQDLTTVSAKSRIKHENSLKAVLTHLDSLDFKQGKHYSISRSFP